MSGRIAKLLRRFDCNLPGARGLLKHLSELQVDAVSVTNMGDIGSHNIDSEILSNIFFKKPPRSQEKLVFCPYFHR